MKIRMAFLFIPLILLISQTVKADDSLTLAVHPYLPDNELMIKFQPLANYLAHKTGLDIKVRVGSTYEEHINFIANNKVDIAYLGPASYVRLTDKFGDKPVLARLEVSGKPYFQGHIITRKDSGISELSDLKGKRIAFGDPESTMSYHVPFYMLSKAEVFQSKFNTYQQFLYSHTNVALAVLAGDFDAGAVKPAVYKKFKEKGLRSIAMTPKISEHLFVVSSGLPPKKIQLLRETMLSMSESTDGLKALTEIKSTITGLVEVKSHDYENLREIIQFTNPIP